jgi:flavin reductase (DIM6/NTAB) family NADH-FMN oxidoreductase RutF
MSAGRSIERMREEEFAGDPCVAALDGTRDGRPLARRRSPRRQPDPRAAAVTPALRALASGVGLITTRVDGRPWGATVTCCSLPLAPPRVLVTLTRDSTSYQAIRRDGRFGLSLLGDGHKALAVYGSITGATKFLDAPVLATDAQMRSPVVRGSLCHVDCDVDRVGRVAAAIAPRRGSTTLPLVYFDGAFHHLGSPL